MATSSPPAAGNAAFELEKAVMAKVKSTTTDTESLPKTSSEAPPENSASLSPSPPPRAWTRVAGEGVTSK